MLTRELNQFSEGGIAPIRGKFHDTPDDQERMLTVDLTAGQRDRDVGERW